MAIFFVIFSDEISPSPDTSQHFFHDYRPRILLCSKVPQVFVRFWKNRYRCECLRNLCRFGRVPSSPLSNCGRKNQRIKKTLNLHNSLGFPLFANFLYQKMRKKIVYNLGFGIWNPMSLSVSKTQKTSNFTKEHANLWGALTLGDDLWGISFFACTCSPWPGQPVHAH